MSPVFLFEVILAHSGVFQGSVISSLLSLSEEGRGARPGFELLCVPDETQIAVYDLRVTQLGHRHFSGSLCIMTSDLQNCFQASTVLFLTI